MDVNTQIVVDCFRVHAELARRQLELDEIEREIKKLLAEMDKPAEPQTYSPFSRAP